MGERDDKKEFYDHFDFRVVGNDLLSETGLLMRGIYEDGLGAARDDLKSDSRLAYHVARAEVQTTHPDIILDWYASDGSDLLLLASLSPPADELDPKIAKLGNFKIDREMASLWLFQKIPAGVRMHVFSLDQLNLEGLEHILR